MKLNFAGNQLLNLLREAGRSLIILDNQPTVDTVAAALALYEVCLQANKTVDIVCLGQLPADVNNLEKINVVKKRIDPTNLVVSFNWAQSMIEKVSYSVEGEKFNLIITPSGKRLDTTSVEYSYRGANYDLVIALGIAGPQSLPANLFDRTILESITTVNIDKQTSNTSYGKVNIIDSQEDSISGIISSILQETKVSVSQKIADLLLLGMRAATNNFEAVKNPATFEHAAFCTKIKNFPPIQNLGINQEGSDEVKNKDWFAPKIMRSSEVS